MHKRILSILALAFILTTFSSPNKVQAESSVLVPDLSSASELVDAVNSLRASHGLAPYQTNSILMSIAQAQAEYIAPAIPDNPHLDANGLHPFQRALAAGYLVAGDLSQGGFFSENISGGVGQTAEDAVEAWMGDDPHRNTMLSGNFHDIGTGVGIYGNTYYYVLDCGLSTGGRPVAYTPPPPLYPSTPTFVPNTPNADGSIIHIVQQGDTILGIALAYDVSLPEILKINGLTVKSIIYPKQKIIIRKAYTPAPTQPTDTPTIHPTITDWPTSTKTSTMIQGPVTVTPPPPKNMSTSAAFGSVVAIGVAALLAAGVITLIGSRKNK
jgi:uncharacterized protein YkwD/LysM repeat protein